MFNTLETTFYYSVRILILKIRKSNRLSYIFFAGSGEEGAIYITEVTPRENKTANGGGEEGEIKCIRVKYNGNNNTYG